MLARSDQAVAGEDVSQPGLIDNNCRVLQRSSLTSLEPHRWARTWMRRSHSCEWARWIPPALSKTSASRAARLLIHQSGSAVAKSGRTTGFTTGTISSINTSVSVQYQAGCNQGKKFTVAYTNQVVINSSTFSAGGDSGSLIVTNNASHNPVALLFAGSSTTTIG